VAHTTQSTSSPPTPAVAEPNPAALRGLRVRMGSPTRQGDPGKEITVPQGQPVAVPVDGLTTRQRRNRPLVIVHTGPGKGKSTAAFGLLLRALGRGFRVGVVQFGKGSWETGERLAMDRFPDQVVWYVFGEGFTWETQDRARDVAAAERAWARAEELMADPSIRLLILDELNIALRYDQLDLAKVVAALATRRPDLHVVVTGRNAKAELIEAADLVTEMALVKHHFAAGVKAQEGIEF